AQEYNPGAEIPDLGQHTVGDPSPPVKDFALFLPPRLPPAPHAERRQSAPPHPCELRIRSPSVSGRRKLDDRTPTALLQFDAGSCTLELGLCLLCIFLVGLFQHRL